MTTREDIAGALTNTVPDVRGYAVRPPVLSPGVAWPRVASWDRGPGQSWSVDWRVIVILAQDETTATNTPDVLMPALIDALRSCMFIDQVLPVLVATEAGNLPALELHGRSE